VRFTHLGQPQSGKKERNVEVLSPDGDGAEKIERVRFLALFWKVGVVSGHLETHRTKKMRVVRQVAKLKVTSRTMSQA